MKASIRTILAAAWISAMVFNASAIERIEGAFGMKLGAIFDPAATTLTPTNLNGVTVYEFSPTNAIGALKHYYVMITPSTHKIYSILGIGRVSDTAAGRREQAVIMEILREKYGFELKMGPVDSMGDVKRIVQDDRHIITFLTGMSDVTLTLRYYDDNLEKVAEQERLAERISKMDKSGL